MEENTTNTETKTTDKRHLSVFNLIGLVIPIIFLAISFNAFNNSVFHLGTSGTNCKIHSTSEAIVYFYPKCPECKHVSELRQVNISKGEKYESKYMCEGCFEIYTYKIKR